MTNEPEMTLEKALRIITSGNGDEGIRYGYYVASGFIAGHAAASKEAEVYREALEKIANHNNRCNEVRCICCPWEAQFAKEALFKGRTT